MNEVIQLLYERFRSQTSFLLCHDPFIISENQLLRFSRSCLKMRQFYSFSLYAHHLWKGLSLNDHRGRSYWTRILRSISCPGSEKEQPPGDLHLIPRMDDLRPSALPTD